MKVNVVFSIFCIFFLSNIFSQVDENWVLNTLKTKSPSSSYIIEQFKKNGTHVSANSRSISTSMSHLEHCDLNSVESFLTSISTTVHETVHAFDSQIPLIQGKTGKYKPDLLCDEGFVIDENHEYIVVFPKNTLFPSIQLTQRIPENLRTFRFNTYIEAGPSQSTQCEGVIGLLEEFNAYYHGSKVEFDLVSLYKETFKEKFLMKWSQNFTSNADAFYEFDFFIKEYLLFAKEKYPKLYEELKANNNFKLVYQLVRSKFEKLIIDYEKQFDHYSLTCNSTAGYITYIAQKHSNLIYPILSQRLNDSRYDIIKKDFLTK